MEEMMYLEVVDPTGAVIDRRGLSECPITIGRDFKNNLIIDDEAVSAQHACVESNSSGGYVLKDSDSANGIFDLNTQTLARAITIDDKTRARIGHTEIRFRCVHQRAKTVLIDHAVIGLAPIKPTILIGTWVLISMGTGVSEWLQSYGESRTSGAFKGTLAVLLLLSLWTAFWSLVSRVCTHQSRFLHHGTIIGLVACYLMLADTLLPLLAFSLSADGFAAVVDELLGVAILTWLFYQHLGLCRRRVDRSRRRAVITFAVVLSLMGVAHGLNYLESREFSKRTPLKPKIYPPVFRVLGSSDLDEFLKESGDVREQVDALITADSS